MSGYPQRLRQERERLGLSQRAMAELMNISKNTQLAYETGASAMPLDYLTRLAPHGVDIVYVATGNYAPDSPATIDPDKQITPAKLLKLGREIDATGDLVEVPEIDLRFGLGGVFMDEHAELQMRSFSRSWLRQISTSPPDKLCWARGRGNSMEPTISEGDILLIDRTQDTPEFGDLYWAIAFGQIGMIKRLRPMPDGSVKILSDNPSVPPETAVDNELHVFGRVVALVKKI